MNTEFIVLIAGFGTCIVVSAFAAIFVHLSLKRFIRNNGGFNNNVYNTEQMKETLTEKCSDGTIDKIKGILERPSILEFDDVVKAFESKDEKPSLIVLDQPTNIKDSSCK